MAWQKLACEAGVSAGTIYHYFKDKNELINETKTYVTQQMANIVQAGISDDMSLKEKYRTLWMNLWKETLHQASLKGLLLREYGHQGTNTELIIKDRPMFEKLDQFWQEGKESGLFKDHHKAVLSSISLETSVILAQKHSYTALEITQDDLDMAIETSWRALLKAPDEH